jgi:hypothetical protein
MGHPKDVSAEWQKSDFVLQERVQEYRKEVRNSSSEDDRVP